MRKLICFLLLFLVLPVIAHSQPTKVDSEGKQEPATKLEQFLSKKGRLYVKDFFEAGEVSGSYGQHVTVTSVNLYEPGKEKEKSRGLKIEVYEGGRLEKTHSSFLDIEEVESLSKAIEYMVKLIENFKGTNREYTEVIFATKGGFKIGFYQKGNEFQAFASSGFIGGTTCFLSQSALSEVKTVINNGLALANK